MKPIVRAILRPSFLIAICAFLLGAVLIAIFSWRVIHYRVTHVPEVDTYGYFLTARAMADGQWPRWQDDFARFEDHVWVNSQNGIAAKYPPGWPVALAIAWHFNGLDGALLANSIIAIVGAILFFILAWLLFGPIAAAICTALWLYSPMLLFYESYPISHCYDATWAVLTMVLAVLWGRSRSLWLALATGLAAGMLPAIRPTSVLIIPAVLAMAVTAAFESHPAWRRRGWQRTFHPIRQTFHDLRHGQWVMLLRRWRGPIAFGMGLLLMLGLLAWYNLHLFGSPFASGYGRSGEDAAFDFSQWRTRAAEQAMGAYMLLTPLAWTLCLAGILLRLGRTALLWTLLLWVVPTFFVYLGYYWYLGADPAFYRFYLSIAPAIVLCAGFLVANAWARWTVAQAAWLVVAGIIGWHVIHLPIENGICSFKAHRQPTPWVEFVRNESAHRPVAFFGSGPYLWTAGLLPNVTGYAMNAWHDQHFMKPATDKCHHFWVHRDMDRHLRLHDEVAALAAAHGGSLWPDFDARVRSALEAGSAVQIMAHADHLLLQRLREWPDVRIETLTQFDGSTLFAIEKAAP